MKILIITLLIGLLGYAISKPLDAKDATDALVEHRSSDIDLHEGEQVLPYYGALKGLYAHIKDGKLLEVSRNPGKTNTSSRQGPVAASSQTAFTELKRQSGSEQKSSFMEDFNKIQQAAARLVAIQELAKRKGNFSPEDNHVYAASLLELGKAAQKLAMLQQTGEIQDFSVLLQPIDNIQMSQKIPPISDKIMENELIIEAEKLNVAMEQHLNEPELLPSNPGNPYEDDNDSVVITPPKKDASVAEARPVGVSIAGEGGVASAKPNAVALSGRNGLAVSAPKATAIAGVSAEETAAFSVFLPNRPNLVIKASNARLFTPSYDNYDEIDTSPVQAYTRNKTITKSANTDGTKVKPMQDTLNASDAIVKMWHAAIAEGRDIRGNDNDLN